MITQKGYEKIKRRSPRYVHILDSIKNLELEIADRQRKADVYKKKFESRQKSWQLYRRAYKRQLMAIGILYRKLDELYDEKIEIEDEFLMCDYYYDVEPLEWMEFDFDDLINGILRRIGE